MSCQTSISSGVVYLFFFSLLFVAVGIISTPSVWFPFSHHSSGYLIETIRLLSRRRFHFSPNNLSSRPRAQDYYCFIDVGAFLDNDYCSRLHRLMSFGRLEYGAKRILRVLEYRNKTVVVRFNEFEVNHIIMIVTVTATSPGILDVLYRLSRTSTASVGAIFLFKDHMIFRRCEYTCNNIIQFLCISSKYL